MEMVQVKWMGTAPTRVETEKGGPKIDIEPKEKFTCTKQVFDTLHKYDKSFMLCGETPSVDDEEETKEEKKDAVDIDEKKEDDEEEKPEDEKVEKVKKLK